MTDTVWAEVDRYLTDLFVPRDAALTAALDASAAAGLPPVNVSPTQGKFLMLMATVIGAHRILEIGTLGGYSTIWLARGLSSGGRVITLELDERHAAVARTNLAKAGLDQLVDLRVGPALQTLPAIAAESSSPFDLIFIDGDRPRYPEYFAWSLKLSRRGSVIIIDNVIRNGAVLDNATTNQEIQGVRRVNQMLADEPRVSATAVPIVGAKGYDGFALALVVG